MMIGQQIYGSSTNAPYHHQIGMSSGDRGVKGGGGSGGGGGMVTGNLVGNSSPTGIGRQGRI